MRFASCKRVPHLAPRRENLVVRVATPAKARRLWATVKVPGCVPKHPPAKPVLWTLGPKGDRTKQFSRRLGQLEVEPDLFALSCKSLADHLFRLVISMANKPNQTKPNQPNPTQTKPNQTKPNQTKPTHKTHQQTKHTNKQNTARLRTMFILTMSGHVLLAALENCEPAQTAWCHVGLLSGAAQKGAPLTLTLTDTNTQALAQTSPLTQTHSQAAIRFRPTGFGVFWREVACRGSRISPASC